MRSKAVSPQLKPEYITRMDASLMMMREFNRLYFLEEFKKMAPLIAAELVRMGVTFPKEQP